MEAKLQVPGWRIEQRFNNKVLIGNWNEERRKFQRGNRPFGNSTNRVDFTHYGSFEPDKSVRREAALQNEGLEKKFIFSHHGNRYSNNLISWYDQHMNQRETKESNLPKLRTWDGKSLAWLPEKTDHPLQGEKIEARFVSPASREYFVVESTTFLYANKFTKNPPNGAPTTFGLLNKMQNKWKKEAENEAAGDYRSTYKSSFNEHSKYAMVFRHFATQKPLSSHFHSHCVNKDLPLRNTHVNMAPEFPPLAVPLK